MSHIHVGKEEDKISISLKSKVTQALDLKMSRRDLLSSAVMALFEPIKSSTPIGMTSRKCDSSPYSAYY